MGSYPGTTATLAEPVGVAIAAGIVEPGGGTIKYLAKRWIRKLIDYLMG
jgi:hypothetical protein